MSSNGLKEVKNIMGISKTITPNSGYGHVQEVVDKRATIREKIIANSSSWQVYFFVGCIRVQQIFLTKLVPAQLACQNHLPSRVSWLSQLIMVEEKRFFKL